ncbi:hypothetical protein CPC08DRAFT_703566 [Agrocybe pediades]|nr:hypothetical protein CPC08DRAFT_703566 [Agrocybe pediades]
MAASSSSLSSVVSNLVRASMGSSVPSTVTDDDLDRHVAELIVREAKKKAERYGQQGIRAYISSNNADTNAPKTNKRFLTSIIKSTDDHNKTVLRAQALAAQEVKREREALERKQRRARAEEAAEAERLRRSGRMGSSSSSSVRKRGTSDDEGWDRWDGRTADRTKRVSRNWESWDGRESDDEEDEDLKRSRRHEKRPERSSRRTLEEPKRRERHSSHTRSPSKDRSRDESRERHDDNSRRHKRRKSRSKERSHKRSRRSTSPRHRSRSPSDRERSKTSKRKRSRSPKQYALDDVEDDTVPARRRSPGVSEAHSEKPAKTPRLAEHKHSTPQPTASSSSRRSPSPSNSRSPSPGPQLPIQLPSKMDRYFEESYDPRLDVAPLEAPKVPATGLINNAEFEGWDAMLELIRIRREDKEEKKRLERLGLLPPKEKSKSKKKAIADTAPAVADRWDSGSVSVMDIEYKKRGSVREWDMGKEGF